jgi:uncharacterized protein (DUF1684 family)
MKTFMDALKKRNDRVSLGRPGFLPALLAGTVLLLLAACHQAADPATEPALLVDQHDADIEDWRHARHARLQASDGWLTLVGLEWLQEGENRVGSGHDNDIVLAAGPPYWGTVLLDGDVLTFTRADSDEVTVDGSLAQTVNMLADTEGEPTLVRSGSLSFYPIFRESYGLRIKDAEAPTLKAFHGIDQYAIDKGWRINGRFERAEPGASFEIVNVLGQVAETPIFGVFEFDMDGRTHSLMAQGDESSESLWFIFNDRTNGRETYGAGRFLYSDGMPEDGRLIVDFNKSYNPPCAFNAYSTCPLPPPENRLDLSVTAGEMDFHSTAN